MATTHPYETAMAIITVAVTPITDPENGLNNIGPNLDYILGDGRQWENHTPQEQKTVIACLAGMIGALTTGYLAMGTAPHQIAGFIQHLATEILDDIGQPE